MKQLCKKLFSFSFSSSLLSFQMLLYFHVFIKAHAAGHMQIISVLTIIEEDSKVLQKIGKRSSFVLLETTEIINETKRIQRMTFMRKQHFTDRRFLFKVRVLWRSSALQKFPLKFCKIQRLLLPFICFLCLSHSSCVIDPFFRFVLYFETGRTTSHLRKLYEPSLAFLLKQFG